MCRFVAVLSYVFFSQALLTAEASLRPLFTVDFQIDNPFPPLAARHLRPGRHHETARRREQGRHPGTAAHPPNTRLDSPAVQVPVPASSSSRSPSWPRFGIPIAVQTAGNLDIGAAVGQYIGSLFLAASFVSIGLFTSSLTRNQVVAFILGLSLTMFLMIMGLDIVAVTLPQRLASLLQDLSPVTHFSSVARGVIHLRDVLYFIALISTFLSATFLIIRGRTLSHRSTQYRNLQLGTAGLIIFSVLIGWSGNSIEGRFDLTEDKLYTLSPATADLVDGLDDILTLELYESREPAVPIALATRDIADFLEDFAAGSDGQSQAGAKVPGGRRRRSPQGADSRGAAATVQRPQPGRTSDQGELPRPVHDLR